MLNLEVIGQGNTTKVYREGAKAIKLYENTSPDRVNDEAERQRFAYNMGLPVPAVYSIRNISDNAVALEMAYVDGQPLFQPGMDKEARKQALLTLVTLQCQVHQIHASGLPKLSDCLMWKIETSKHLNNEYKSALLSLNNRLRNDADNLCHGDFHPLNILFDGTKSWIIDWVDATAGNPLADACRTYIIIKQFLSRSAGIYLKMYCQVANQAQADVLAWQPIIAAARLNENMDDQSRAWLLALVQDWYNTLQ